MSNIQTKFGQISGKIWEKIRAVHIVLSLPLLSSLSFICPLLSPPPSLSLSSVLSLFLLSSIVSSLFLSSIALSLSFVLYCPLSFFCPLCPLFLLSSIVLSLSFFYPLLSSLSVFLCPLSLFLVYHCVVLSLSMSCVFLFPSEKIISSEVYSIKKKKKKRTLVSPIRPAHKKKNLRSDLDRLTSQQE